MGRYMPGGSLKSIALFLAIFISIPAQSIEIENFKSGLMCGINKDDMGWVCFEQEEIKITGQSSCVSNGQELKCTWYGYSFEYKNAKPRQKIDCKFWDSKPVREINLEGVVSESSKYVEHSFYLTKTEGYFVNPQYSVLNPSDSERITQSVSCSSEGIDIYQYKFISVQPADK
jgi:hypothetical protein